MSFKPIVILTFLITGCSHNVYRIVNGAPLKQCNPPTFVIAYNTSKEMSQLIERSFNYWNEATTKKLFVYGGHWTKAEPDLLEAINIVVVQEKDLEYPVITSREIVISEKGRCIFGGKIYVRRGEIVPELETALRKEAGYLTGLNASPDFTSLMSSKVEPTMQHPVDANDEEINAVRKLYSPSGM